MKADDQILVAALAVVDAVEVAMEGIWSASAAACQEFCIHSVDGPECGDQVERLKAIEDAIAAFKTLRNYPA